MTRVMMLVAALALLCGYGWGAETDKAADGFIPLFDGRTLNGWKAGEHADSFQVKEGAIVAHGPVAHLFYLGDVEKHDFTDFHFKAEVMTTPGSNSGLYIHTRYQESGWPANGYEIQVNQTHRDPKKSSGLYGVRDVMTAPAKDNEWYTQEILVRGKQVITKVNGQTLVDYTEPSDIRGPRKLSSGTFAIQAHDPNSTVYVRNICVKPLE